MSFSTRWLFWVLASAIALLILTLPVSVTAQLALGLAALVLMMLVWRWGRRPLARQLFLACGTFIVIRYGYWRLADSLPPLSDFRGFIFGLTLVAAEFYCVCVLALSLFINVDPLRRRPLDRDSDEDLPTVDVFIPTYNEDENILATTVAAARSMDYPPDKLNTWLLDDGGTDQKCNDADPGKAAAARMRRASLQILCREMGAHYLTRANNSHAKAGNLNSALAHSSGQVIAVFDADHAPFRAFLRETVGHFKRDPKLFLVQTPHVFLNPDPIEKNLQTFQTMPSENEMFYSITQCGLDKWNSAFFCGSAALLRREALMAAKGFSGITITEDCETALDLHAKGWRSIYVDKPMVAGLQPETFASFIGQRSRWCQGMLQILMLKSPLLKRGLKPIQRLAYFSCMLFWFFPIPRLIFMFAPLLYIFFNINIVVANLGEALAYSAIYVIVNAMMQNYLYGAVRWPWVSELYEYVQGVFVVRSLVSVLSNPRKPTFNVTAKGLSLENDHLSELALPFFLIWGLLVIAALIAAYRFFFDPSANGLLIVVFFWNAFNLMIAGAALGAVAERAQPDRHPSLGVNREGELTIEHEHYPVRIHSVSAGGCAFSFLSEPPAGLTAGTTRGRLVAKPALGAEHPRLVAEHIDRGLPVLTDSVTYDAAQVLITTMFKDLKPRDYFVLADMMYADYKDIELFLQSRRNFKSLLAGSLGFIGWGVREPFRAIRYALSRPPERIPETAPEKFPETAAQPAEVAA